MERKDKGRQKAIQEMSGTDEPRGQLLAHDGQAKDLRRGRLNRQNNNNNNNDNNNSNNNNNNSNNKKERRKKEIRPRQDCSCLFEMIISVFAHVNSLQWSKT